MRQALLSELQKMLVRKVGHGLGSVSLQHIVMVARLKHETATRQVLLSDLQTWAWDLRALQHVHAFCMTLPFNTTIAAWA